MNSTAGIDSDQQAAVSITAREPPRSRMSASGPGCVKTCMSRECTELFSLFPSFDGDCQSYSFLIPRNRDRLSTRKSDVGVFTQPGSKADVKQQMLDVRSSLSFGARSVHQ